MDWFKCDWQDREGRRLTKWSHVSMVGSHGEVPLHATILYRPAPACAYLATADVSNLLLVFEADHHCRRVRFTPGGWGSVIQGPCYASTNRRGRRMIYPAVCSKWVTQC